MIHRILFSRIFPRLGSAITTRLRRPQSVGVAFLVILGALHQIVHGAGQSGSLPPNFPIFFEEIVPGETYVSQGLNHRLALKPQGAELALRSTKPGRSCCDAPVVETATLRVTVVGANPRPTLAGLARMESVSHYFTGADSSHWRAGVPHFAKVRYEGVYPGVDLIYYGNEGRLEFDFLLAPGADPSPIALDFAGADSLRLEENGNLVLATGQGEVLLHRPRVFQEVEGKRIPIAGDFVLDGASRVRFALGVYDPAQPLVIDPVLSMVSYVTATAADVAVDKNGHVHVVGSAAFQKDQPTTTGVVQPSLAGGFDIYSLKFDPESSRILHATYLGGSDADIAMSIAVDAEGNALITGRTFSADFPLANATQSKLEGITDAFVAKLDPNGARLIYSTYLGGAPRFEMEPLSIDFGQVTRGQPKDATITIRNKGPLPFSVCAGTGGGNVTFVGTTASCLTGSEDKFVNFSAKITVPALSQTSFTIRFSPGGRGHDKGRISFRRFDQPLFAELPWKGEGLVPPFPADPPPPPDKTTYKNKPPFYFVDSDSADEAVEIALDQVGNAYVAGNTFSGNFPTLNAFQSGHGGMGDGFLVGASDAFVTKFSPTGQVMFSTYLGGKLGDATEGIAVDREGNSYVAGTTGSPNFPSTTSIHPFEEFNSFVVKLNPAGSALLYSTLLGISVRDISIDNNGSAYLTGRGGHTNLPTPNAFQKAFMGGQDAFVAKLNPEGASMDYFTRLAGSDYDEGSSIAVDSTGSAFVTGRTKSRDFPVKEPVQQTYGGDLGNFEQGEIFVTQLSSDGSALLFSTYFGGPGDEWSSGIALDLQGRILIVGGTTGGIATKNPMAGLTSMSGGFVAMFTGGGQAPQEIQLWQKMEIPAPTGNDPASAFKVEFVRMIDGKETRVESEILAIRPGFVTVRVPPGLLGPGNVSAPPTGLDRNVSAEVLRVSSRQQIARQPLALRMPQPIIVDEVDLRPGAPASLRTLSQFVFNTGAPNIHTFSYLGASTDGTLALRVLNSEFRLPAPLRFDADGLSIFEPAVGSAPPNRLLPFSIPNLGSGNHGAQFPVSRNGLHVIAIEPSESSPGPFPARYQLHLAGNVGLPRKLINGAPEAPRGTRLDTLFNHSAPRPGSLSPGDINVARTALFKFANVASVSPFARAVLLPPPAGFVSGMRITRAADPTAPLETTTPTARTPECAAPVIGNVIDFTQIPDPASVLDPSPVLAESVCAVIGQNDGNAVTLPKTLAGGVTLPSLILDMGSGHEIVDGVGPDFEVLASSGSYTVQVGNTPFVSSFSPSLGPFTGVRQIDLASSGLPTARYVWITPSPSVTLDAVRNLNLLADEISPNIGPITHVTSATITARRAKLSANKLDPFLQLIAPNGDLFTENEAGFGDDLSQDLSDAAVINRILPQDGFYRYLVKGFDKQPDEQSTGAFLTRLETSGNYDPVELAVSDRDEAGTAAQKTGVISATRQRDSYLFQATPGQRLSIVVNAKGNGPKVNPVVELHDPEEFLIAANDDFAGRDRNAALTVTLPPLGQDRGTYRVVVSAVDSFGGTGGFSGGTAHVRRAAAGEYELKVFTGAMIGSTPALVPDIDLQPTALDFGEVPVGQSKELTLTVFNKGTGPLRVTSLSPGNEQIALVSPAIPFDVAAGGQQSVALRFTPRSVAPVAVTLAVNSNDPDEAALTVPLAGKPTAPPTQAQTAKARLTSLSLRFQKGSASFGGENFTFVLGAGASNGELAYDGKLSKPADLLTLGAKAGGTSHFAAYTLTSADGAPFSDGEIELDLPPMSDSNRDGAPDFFDVKLGVAAAKSKGVYFDSLGVEGPIEAIWTRAAGSPSGTCLLTLSLDLGGFPFPLTTTSTFELVAYEGVFTYKPEGAVISGPIELSLVGVAPGPDVDRSLKTTQRLTRQSSDALAMPETEWTNESGKKYFAEPFGVARTGARFLSAVEFSFDGGKDGYLVWMLDLVDGNDADGDGVPDLSDEPNAPPPSTGLAAWRATQFPASVLADSSKEASVWGDRANADGDLLPNLVEYGMGLNPTIADAAPLRLERTPSGSPSLVFRQAKNAPGVELFPEWTAALGAWRRDQVIREVISETADAMIVRATFPSLANGKSGFARLAAEKR